MFLLFFKDGKARIMYSEVDRIINGDLTWLMEPGLVIQIRGVIRRSAKTE